MTRNMRDDGRLGVPVPSGAALDHLCPVCEGEGAACSVECFCDGLGVISAADADEFAALAELDGDRDPRWKAHPLPVVPSFTGKPCADCAFRPDSPERHGVLSARGLFEHLATCTDDHLALGSERAQFFCHAGMHHGAKGYIPRQRDERGAPIGHPICAGWLAQYRRTLR